MSRYNYTAAQREAAPDFSAVATLTPGVYPALYLNPPGGADCAYLLVREDRSLGWCYRDGEQHEDSRGRVSRFSVADLCDVES